MKLAGPEGFSQWRRGVIGSRLCEELLRQDVRLRALVRYNSRETYGWLEDSPLELRRSGTETAIGDLITLIGELIGTEPLVDRDPSRVRPEKSEVQRFLSDNTQVRALLNWQPPISLKEGLRSTIAWFQSHMHLHHRALEEYVV